MYRRVNLSRLLIKITSWWFHSACLLWTLSFETTFLQFLMSTAHQLSHGSIVLFCWGWGCVRTAFLLVMKVNDLIWFCDKYKCIDLTGDLLAPSQTFQIVCQSPIWHHLHRFHYPRLMHTIFVAVLSGSSDKQMYLGEIERANIIV